MDISFKSSYGVLTPLNRISRLPPWNTKGLVEKPSNQPNCNEKQTTVMKDSFDISTVGNFHNQWKSRPYDKENQHIQNGKSYAQLNKVNNNYKVVNQGNLEEMNVSRPADETTFKSSIKENSHIDNRQ